MGRVELESRPSDTQAWKFSLGPWSVVKTKKRVLGFALVWRRASVTGLAGPLPAVLARRGDAPAGTQACQGLHLYPW